MSCYCKLKSCIMCKDNELKETQRKLSKYQKALESLMDDSMIQENYTTKNSLYESIIVDKDSEGRTIQKANSRIGDSFIIVEKKQVKKIEHLSNKELYALQAQDDLNNYEAGASYFKKGTYIYGAITFATKIGKFFIGFL